MIRRWSYIDNSSHCNFPDSAPLGSELTQTYLKKNFRNNVRSKKLQHNLTRVSRKRYSFRKLKNSAIVLLWHASSWAYYNRQSKLLQSRELFFAYFGAHYGDKSGLLLLKAGAVSPNANLKFMKSGFAAYGRGLAQNPSTAALGHSANMFNSLLTLPTKVSLSFRRVYTLLILNKINQKINNPVLQKNVAFEK